MSVIIPAPQPPQGIVFVNPADLITTALQQAKVVGIGRNATAAEIIFGLKQLNILLDELSIVRDATSVRVEELWPLVTTQNVYAMGPGSTDFDTVRPIKIELAFIRDNSNAPNYIDYALDCTMVEEEYVPIAIKNQSSIPTQLWYEATVPFGTITLDCLPNKAYELHTFSWKPFTQITDPGDGTQLVWPDGFPSMIMWNLAEIIREGSGKPADPFIHMKAIKTLSDIKSVYRQAAKVTQWDIPGAGMGSINPRSIFTK